MKNRITIGILILGIALFSACGINGTDLLRDTIIATDGIVGCTIIYEVSMTDTDEIFEADPDEEASEIKSIIQIDYTKRPLQKGKVKIRTFQDELEDIIEGYFEISDENIIIYVYDEDNDLWYKSVETIEESNSTIKGLLPEYFLEYIDQNNTAISGKQGNKLNITGESDLIDSITGGYIEQMLTSLETLMTTTNSEKVIDEVFGEVNFEISIDSDNLLDTAIIDVSENMKNLISETIEQLGLNASSEWGEGQLINIIDKIKMNIEIDYIGYEDNELIQLPEEILNAQEIDAEYIPF